jgi:hypothetical protein
MTEEYKATPEQWSAVEGVAKIGSADCAAILELRARVEALEEAQRPRVFTADEVAPIVVSAAPAPARESVYTDAEWAAIQQWKIQRWNKINDSSPAPAPAGSLVERVRNAISSEYDPKDYCWDEARAAIREVAAWLQERSESNPGARLLDLEAKPTRQEGYEA